MGFWDAVYPGQMVDPGLPPGYQPQPDPLTAAMLAQRALAQNPQGADYTPMGDAPLTGLGARLSGYIADKGRGLADSLGNAASLPGRALYGPDAAGYSSYGPATPDQAMNAAGWVTMPSLGRAAVAGALPRDVLGMSGASDVASGMGEKGIPAYHAHYGDPFDKFDFSRLGETVLPNVEGQSNEGWAMNLAKLGAWAHERPLTQEMGTQSMPVSIMGQGKSFKSLDALERSISKAGGPEAFRQQMLDSGYGHVAVQDEEFGGKSYVALSPDHFVPQRPFADPNSGAP